MSARRTLFFSDETDMILQTLVEDSNGESKSKVVSTAILVLAEKNGYKLIPPTPAKLVKDS